VLRQRLADSYRPSGEVVLPPPLRRAELSFAAAWTAECAFTVGLGVTVAAGTVVVHQSEPGDGFYVITEGRAEVLGDGALVGTLDPGDSFGEIALLHDVPRTATIGAATDVTVFALEREDFLDALAGIRASADAARDVVAGHLANFRPAGAAT
jgi:CRP-like cAMP-binding protein